MNSQSAESTALLQQLNSDKIVKEHKLIFKWKFILIGFCLVLLVMIAICSSLVTSIAKSKNPSINTTFFGSLLLKSDFLKGDLLPARNFIKIFNQTEFMKFDKATNILNNPQYSANKIAESLKSKQNLLVFIELDGQDNFNNKFGMYLHPQFPYFDSETQNVSISATDHKSELISVLFSLENPRFTILNKSQSCSIYQYSQNTTNSFLSFMELIHFDDDYNSTSSVPIFSIKNYFCFAKNEQTKGQIQKEISQIVGMDVSFEQKKFNIKNLEIFSLSMDSFGFESTS